MSNKPIIAVDLDGTLAFYEHWVAIDFIGAPIPRMVERVKHWIQQGQYEVVIFTARVAPPLDRQELLKCRAAIERWCLEHIGTILPITCEKNMRMVEFWDDRAVSVEQNTGNHLSWRTSDFVSPRFTHELKIKDQVRVISERD